MDYEHYVFVSYAHGDKWTDWVRKRFEPYFSAYLEKEIGRLHRERPNVFVDDQIQPGDRWEKMLKHKVARSKVMVSLVCPIYFQSIWCRREMALMLERERRCGLETGDESNGFLFPVQLSDGKCFPDLIKSRHPKDFDDCTYLDIPQGTNMEFQFQKKTKELAQVVARALERELDCCEEWRDFTGQEFFDQLAYQPPVPKPPRMAA